VQKINQLIVNSAIAHGLDVIGDRWSLLILRDAFLGRSRFEQFRRHSGISKATLTRRLDALITEGVLYKGLRSEGAKRSEYRLTEKGVGLFSSSLLAWQWELEWGTAEQERQEEQLPHQLFHRTCQHELYPQAVCKHCRQAFGVDDVQLTSASPDATLQLDEIKSLSGQRRVRSSVKSGEEDVNLANISDLIGDRWTLLLLISAFFGHKRYDGFLKQLNIASNILTARLKFLVEVGVFKRRSYQVNPPRSEYHLSDKGRSLYPIVMAMRQWVVDGLAEQEHSAVLIHKSCGQSLVVDVQCRACAQPPTLTGVQFIERETSA